MQKVTTWDHNAVALLKAVHSSPFGVKRLLDDPRTAAAGFGFDLDPGLASELAKLNLATFFATSTGADEELADFLHTTIVDGRYLHEWLTNPTDVAHKLDLAVSAAVITRIQDMNTQLNIKQSAGITGRSHDIAVRSSYSLCIQSKGKEYRVIEPPYFDRF